MIRINQAAFVETVNQFIPDNLTWHFSGGVPDVLTEPVFKKIKWLKKGQTIEGNETSLPSPVTFSVFSEAYTNNRKKFSYTEARKTSYPSIAEQLDMIWHAIDSDTLDKSSDFYIRLKAVKDANPKA